MDKLFISVKSAGGRQIFTKILVTGDIVAQCFQGTGSHSGQTDKLKLQQNAAARGTGGALESLVDHAAKPTSCIIFKSQEGIDQFTVLQAEVRSADAVPAVCAQTLPLQHHGSVGCGAVFLEEGKVFQWPLPPHINLLTLIAGVAIGCVENAVGARVVTGGQRVARRLVSLSVKLNCRVK